VELEFFRQEGAVAPFREQVRLIGPLSCSINLAFVAKRDPRPVNSLADLRGRRIGILIGNVLATRLLEQAGLPFEALGQRKALFQMLDLGRLDVVIEPERSGLTGLQESGLGEKLEQRGAALTHIPNYLVLRHRLDDWGPRLQRVATEAVATGRWQQWMGDQNAKAGIPRSAGLGCLPAPKR
jgi:ABC-type amino acid transport substrate-binding protein